MSSTRYSAGAFAVPAGTGNLVVTLDLPAMVPHTIIFFGSNQGTEDAVVNVAAASIFMGMMTRQAGGTWLSRVNSVIPVSTAAGTRGDCCINAITGTGFGIQYRATAVSSSAGSFTVNFSTVAASRFVHYLAIGNSGNYEAVFNNIFVNPTSVTNLTWPVRAMFHIGGYTYDGGGVNYENGSLAFGFTGGAAYPGYPTLNRGDASSLSYSTGGFGQKKLKQYNVIGTAPPIVDVGESFIGPFLNEVEHHAYRSPTNTDFTAEAGGFGDSALFGFWDGDADTGSGTPSGSVAGTASFPTQRTPIVDALIFFSANGLAQGPGINSSALAVGFGVWTPTYQGCCHLNGNGGSYLYQSRSKSWCSTADASGAVAGTVVRTPGGFNTVTAVAGTSPSQLIWWGPVHGVVGKPKFLRRPGTKVARLI